MDCCLSLCCIYLYNTLYVLVSCFDFPVLIAVHCKIDIVLCFKQMFSYLVEQSLGLLSKRSHKNLQFLFFFSKLNS